MTQIISIVNQKGGVGKTTTAVNLAAYLAEQGNFVLLIDLDPQANATSGVGLNHRELDRCLYDALVGLVPLRDVIRSTRHQGFYIAPSGQDLAGANVELVNMERREFKLTDIISEVRSNYDYILIDCPPSLGLLTINGLVAADQILIPVQAEYYALEGLSQLLNTIKLVTENLKPQLSVLGAILTMYDKRAGLSQQVLHELYKHFPNKIFRSVIPRNVRLSEAPSHGKTILEYDPNSKGGRAYRKLTQEVLMLYSHA